MGDDNMGLMIDDEKGVDLFDILRPLVVSHSLSLDNINNLSRQCTTIEGVGRVISSLALTYNRKLKYHTWAMFAKKIIFGSAYVCAVVTLVLVIIHVLSLVSVLSFRYPIAGAVLLYYVITTAENNFWCKYDMRFQSVIKTLEDMVILNKEKEK